MKSIYILAATAALLAACGNNNSESSDRTDGPVVSESEAPRNEAIDTTPTGDGAQATPGANSFTESQARGAIEGQGYTAVGELTQNEQGLWQGMATKGGAESRVSVDYKGTVTPAQ